MSRAPYRVFYMNTLSATFDDREKALAYVNARASEGQPYGDFEILDASDDTPAQRA